MQMLSLPEFCRGSTIGICYGRNADDLPTPDKAVELVQQHNVKYVRIYDANIQVLKAFANTGIELMIGIPNSDLLAFAQFQSNADTWLKNNILPYYPATRITFITVGSEATEFNSTSLVVPAMQNVLTALKKGSVDVITGANITSSNGTTCDVACSFGGSGVKVDKNPSYDKCIYMTAGINKTLSTNTTAMPSTSSSLACKVHISMSMWTFAVPVLFSLVNDIVQGW
ncbi:hypothetical protein SAY86_017002 [Trapa natans]|uniref:glucan endo-1,3-beta-D-glucosidase n=1 Tax=Trapa natans TaxID=22666 RepID=A0AAN7M0L2_TRANT|nr:hypothetical protein SAY86_017002 [Trapa natans]